MLNSALSKFFLSDKVTGTGLKIVSYLTKVTVTGLKIVSWKFEVLIIFVKNGLKINQRLTFMSYLKMTKVTFKKL